MPLASLDPEQWLHYLLFSERLKVLVTNETASSFSSATNLYLSQQLPSLYSTTMTVILDPGL